MTVENFSLLEALELAINLEEEGITFYTLAADLAGNPEVKELFLALREKEYEHLNTFRGLYSDMSSRLGDPDAALYLTDPDVAAYFRAFVESAVFPAKGAAEELARSVHDASDALRLGLRIEKDSVMYYQELVHHSPFPDAEQALRKVIEEEKRHFFQVYELWKKYAGKHGLGEPFARG